MDATEQARPFIKFAQRTHRTTLVIAIVILIVLLVTLVNVALAPDDVTFDADNFFEMEGWGMIWITLLIHPPLLIVLLMGIPVFNLVVKYRGERSGRKYLNDWSTENSKFSLSAISSMTTRLGVVICFSPSYPLPGSEK